MLFGFRRTRVFSEKRVSRPMTEKEEAAFDAVFEQVGKTFEAVDKLFDEVRKSD